MKKDDSELKKVGEIDYGKHEKMEKQLEYEEEIKKWQEKAGVGPNVKPPGCAHDHQ